MRRAAETPELLDGPLDPRVLAGNLRDLERVNRLLGGADLSWRALRLVAGELRDTCGTVRMLDVGTGAADVPLTLVRRARRHGLRLHVHATDVRAEIVEAAHRRTSGEADLVVSLGDHRAVAAGPFDVAHASLVLHHLEPVAAVAFLAQLADAAGVVIINDLDRGRAWWLAAWMLTRLATLNRYTRHDAPLSVRRAYRPDEVAAMGRQAGLHEVARLRGLLGHRYATVFRRTP